jgi:membrane protease YdiL (CAAX protease family)
MLVAVIIGVITITAGTWVQVSRPMQHKVFLRRMLASIIMLGVPLGYDGIINNFEFSGWSLNTQSDAWVITLLLSLIAIAVNYKFAGRPENISRYPQLRVHHWTSRLLVSNFLTLSIYTATYEFLFRGFLFFVCLQHTDFWTSTIINVIIYSAAHAHQGLRETVLSIPFGVILCAVTMYMGAFWGAVVIHLALAWSNELFSIQRNPAMSVSLN